MDASKAPEVPEFVKKMFPNGPPKGFEKMYPNGPPPEILAMLMKGAQTPVAPAAEKPVEKPTEKTEEKKTEKSKDTLKKSEPKTFGAPPANLKMGPPAGMPMPPPGMPMGPPPAGMPMPPAGMPMGPPPAGMPMPPPGVPLEIIMEMIQLGMTPPKGKLEGKEAEAKEELIKEMREDFKSDKKEYDYDGKFPDAEGYFGVFGGVNSDKFKKEDMPKLMKNSVEVKRLLNNYVYTDEFKNELMAIRRDFQGRPTPLYECKNIENLIKQNNNGKSGRIFIKREDLNHTGAHKINHCMAEGLMAKKLGKKCLIAGTGAGQHGLAVATAAAYFGLDCKIFMGTIDIAKEHPNVSKMKVLGAEVIPVDVGGKSLKEANDASIQYFLDHPDDTFQCIGSVVAVHPWPQLVREFQRCIGDEAREQILEKTGKLPNHVVACIGGGSNSIGTFSAFINNKDIKLYPVEPLGRGTKFGDHAACLIYGKRGLLHGAYSYVLMDENNEYKSHSVASGLCYPAVGPEHAFLKEIERTFPVGANDHEALEAFFLLSRKEGIIPALESSHGFVQAVKLAKQYPDDIILCNISGRGDKDVDYVMENYPEYAKITEYDLIKN